ncbi:MAG: cation transporter, partial [Rhodothermales bacterium]
MHDETLTGEEHGDRSPASDADGIHWHIPVEGMTCAACALRIERKLGKVSGVA